MEILRTNRNAVVVVIVLLTATLLFGLFTNNREASKRNNKTAPEYVPEDAPASVAGAEDLYRLFDDDTQFTELRKDIAFFGKSALPDGTWEESEPVSFEVTSKIDAGDKEYGFSGVYAGTKDNIRIKVSRLSSSKVATSITNTRNGGNIDSRLPSNSKQNRFIGSLPYDNGRFKIVYNTSVKSFTLTALQPGPEVRQEGMAYITDGMGMPKDQLKILFMPFLY